MNWKKNPATNDCYIKRILKDERYKVKRNGTLWTRISINGAGLMPGTVWRRCGSTDSHGYAVFKPRFDGVRTKVAIHRLIFAAFCGALDEDKVINHLDGDRMNNKPDNLELVDWDVNLRWRA